MRLPEDDLPSIMESARPGGLTHWFMKKEREEEAEKKKEGGNGSGDQQDLLAQPALLAQRLVSSRLKKVA